jgi:(p)ppGpp synthase/HD superfamily hydrolase
MGGMMSADTPLTSTTICGMVNDMNGELKMKFNEDTPPIFFNSPFAMMAATFAAGAHAAINHRRKYTGEPYFDHCEAVATIVSTVTADIDVIAAAFLHDVVEDTQVTNDDIRHFFEDKVARLVAEVTDVSRPEDGNRRVRKEIDRQHLAKASPEGKTIKLADLIDNSKDIIKGDPNFAKVYMREKRALLEVLVGGDPTLYAQASRIVEDYYHSRFQP